MKATLILIDKTELDELITRACERAVQVAIEQLNGKARDRWITVEEAKKELGYKSNSGFYAIKPQDVFSTTNRNGRILYSLNSVRQYMEDNKVKRKS